jgi:hypothetical protein
MACGPNGYRGEAWLKKGLLCSKQRCPFSLTGRRCRGEAERDGPWRNWDGPHKRSVTIDARDSREVLRATGTVGTDIAGYRAMLRFARQWPDRMWAVEGANGSVARWRSGCSPEGNGCWTCQRN